MMNLDEILRGIGQQMSRAVPQWDSGALQPQVQAPSFGMGPWGQAANSMFGSPEYGGGFQMASERPDNFGLMPERSPFQQEALGHVQAATAAVSPAGQPSNDPAEQEAYIRQAAAARHIDPEVAVRVWGSEGKPGYIGDNGSSFGPYQLHYGNVAGGGNAVSGLGDAFTKATGLDARDPATWKAQVDFSLNHAAKNGWGPWHGYSGGAWDGIGSYNVPAQAMPGLRTQQVLVGLLAQGGHKLGETYDWGGAGQQGRGFDCSGLVSWVGQQLGVPGIAPRETTFTLFPKTQAIGEQDAQPGDLVFYNMDSSRADMQHVAIYLGGGKILQSGGATQHAVNVGDAHQAVGSAPIFRRYAPLTQAIGQGGLA